MKERISPTTSKLLPTTMQQRVELPAFPDSTKKPGENGGDRELLIELALTVELRIRIAGISPSGAKMAFGVRTG